MKTTTGLLSVFCFLITTTFAQPTTFTYQGHLIDGSAAVEGVYDVRLTLYDSASNGVALASFTNSPTSISNGLFSVAVDFSADFFDGSARWLEVGVRTNGSNAAFVALLPRQSITSVPYAVQALNAAVVSNGVYTSSNQTFAGANQFTNSSNVFVGNGSGLTSVNAATLNGLPSTKFWQTSGNSGTTSANNYLGTTDNQPLELKVNGARAFRLEPVTTGGPNVIGGSSLNTVVTGVNSGTIAGGNGNSISTNASASSIAGGEGNAIQSNADHSVIAGGYNNAVQVSAFYSTVGGGSANIMSGANSTISGGNGNVIRGFSSSIGGGSSNTIETNAYSSAIGGGVFNTIGTNATYCTIAGGFNNYVQTNAAYAVISGGNLNTIQTNAQYATIAGGQNNSIGTNANYSFAAGRRAKANHAGSFVWADSSNYDFASTTTNSFSVRALGGVRFVTAVDGTGLGTNGVSLAAGSGTWSSLSDRNAKENFTRVDTREVLQKLASVPLTTWNYKTQDKSIRHIGPMAQDFAAAFHVGEDERHITTIDEEGVALAAIQGLNEVVRDKDTEISQLKARNDSLEKRLSDLEQLVKSLAARK